MSVSVKAFFHASTWTLTYVVWDPETRDAVVVDPALDFDPAAVRIGTEFMNEVSAFIRDQALHLRGTFETHAHADHLTGAQVLKERFGCGIYAGDTIPKVQRAFAGIFNRADFTPDGSDFDGLVADGELVQLGSLTIAAIATPGHTPACVSWKIGDAVFVGDALFMPDFGTGRCDFPGGSAETLYDSIQKLYALPDDTRLFVGHDYQPGGRELAFEVSVAESKASNKHVKADTTKEEFVGFRTERDAQLSVPKLILPSLQVNMRAGILPEPEGNGTRYLKLPINLFA